MGVTGALSLHVVTRTVTPDTEYLGLGNGMKGEVRAACRTTTELHRKFTLSWQTMLARGIAVIGPSILVELDVRSCPRPRAVPGVGCRRMASVSDVRHVLVLPDRDAAEEVAEALRERFGVEEEPRLVREALAGEDDAEDAQWLVLLGDADGRLDAGELDAFVGEWDGWREQP